MNPIRATLQLAGWIAVVGIALVIGCKTLPQPRPMPFQTALAMAGYSDPPHPTPVRLTNTVALPTLPGMTPQSVTNVSVRPIAHALAVLPPRVVTNIVSIREQIPPNGGNDTNRRWTILQSSHDLTHWSTVTSNEQLSGHYVTNNVASTNSRTFFRTVSQ